MCWGVGFVAQSHIHCRLAPHAHRRFCFTVPVLCSRNESFMWATCSSMHIHILRKQRVLSLFFITAASATSCICVDQEFKCRMFARLTICAAGLCSGQLCSQCHLFCKQHQLQYDCSFFSHTHGLSGSLQHDHRQPPVEQPVHWTNLAGAASCTALQYITARLGRTSTLPA